MTTASPAAPVALRGHIPALDGLRGVAILLVIAFHVGVALGPLATGRGLADRVLLRAYDLGWSGVDLFFVLSGFLITGILLDAKSGAHYFRSFYARRFLRIFPAYYAFLLVLLALALLGPPSGRTLMDIGNFPRDQWYYWTYTFDFLLSLPALTPSAGLPAQIHLWSLAVEEQFYIVWPLVVFAASRRVLPWLCLALIVVALALRVYFAAQAHGALGEQSVYVYYFAPTRIDGLAAGALLACIVRSQITAGVLARSAAAVGLGALAGLTAIYVYTGEFGVLRFLRTPETYASTIGFTLVAGLFVAVLALALVYRSAAPVRGMLGSRALTAIGRYSYAIYLIHALVIQVYALILLRRGGLPTLMGSYVPALLASTALMTAISFAIAWASWHLFEERFLRLKRLFPYGSTASASRDERLQQEDRPLLPAPVEQSSSAT